MEKTLKLSEWAKENNIPYSSAIRMFRKNEITGSYKTDTGSIMIKIESNKLKSTIGYIRVKPSLSKDSVDEKVIEFKKLCKQQGLKTDKIIVEKAGMLDERRPKLNGLLESGQATELVVLQKSDLYVFGRWNFELLCKKVDCKITELKSKEVTIQYISQVMRAVTYFFERM